MIHIRRSSFTVSALACSLCVLSLGGCAGAAAKSAGEAAGLMSGSFSSKAQSERDPAFFAVHLHMAPIWPLRDDGPWLYVEQAMATSLDKPYRQRVYHVVGLDARTVRSDVYELPGDPLAFAGAWRDPSKINGFSPDDLVLRDGCSITLVRQPDGEWQGSTDGTSCPSSLRGAKYATSEVRVVEDLLLSWDRGFDASGTQVWGAKSGAYEFVRER